MDPISLHTIIGDYSHIRVATPDDNEAILDFCSSIAMNTNSMSLRYDRSPDYFAFLKEQCAKSFVFVFMNKDDSIGGICTLALKKQYVSGELTQLAYLCDLRTSPKLYRLARVQWRNCYARVVANCRNIIEFDQCQYFYSAVLAENSVAQSALVQRRKHYVYREIGTYKAVSILGRLPFSFPLKKPGVWLQRRRHSSKQRPHIRRATAEDVPALRKFLATSNKIKTLGEHIVPDSNTADELKRRFDTWENFSIDSFILATDDAGSIVSCVAPWVQNQTRRMVIDGLSPFYKALSSILSLAGKPKVKNGGVVKALNLTHLEFAPGIERRQRQSLFFHMLEYISKTKEYRDCHITTFIDTPQLQLKSSLISSKFIMQSTPGRLYQVMSPDDFSKGINLPDQKTRPLTFEVGVA
ncbi:MAG: hypothetical protein HRU19_15580 [Pseudobacteriovorax sp.]|nr:hypothetical protein [Pseudobacteriovorax sp.]